MNINEYNYELIKEFKGKILIIGIGGGSDIVGAYALAKIIKLRNPNAIIDVGVAVTPKQNYSGFHQVGNFLYQVEATEDSDNIDFTELHHTLSLIKLMTIHDKAFRPYLFIRPKYNHNTEVSEHQAEVANALINSLEHFKADFIIASDNGGDSLTGGMSDFVEKEFDRTGIRGLQKFGSPFDYLVLGPGCDGESTKEMIILSIERESESFKGSFDIDELASNWSDISENYLPLDRTPNIILSAIRNISSGTIKDSEEIEIVRHRKPLIPIGWLRAGLVFDGIKFKG